MGQELLKNKEKASVISPPEKLEYMFVCPLPNGLHARPANRLEQVVGAFKSSVSIENLNNKRTANAKSVLSLVGADVKQGDQCLLSVVGEDCEPAYKTVVEFIEKELPTCDEKLPEVHKTEAYVPPVIEASGAKLFTGFPAVSGFARGKVVKGKRLHLPEDIADTKITDVKAEQELLQNAVKQLRDNIASKLQSDRISKLEKDVLTAQMSISSDEEMIEFINTSIAEHKCTAGEAILRSYEHFSKVLGSAKSELIRERVVDLHDVSSQLINRLYNIEDSNTIELEGPSICIANDITPSQFIAMDKSNLMAMALVSGSTTSHTIILARSYGIPTIVGVKEACACLPDEMEVIVDANYGLLICEINENVERFYKLEQEIFDARSDYLTSFIDKPAETSDGKTIAVTANITSYHEVQGAMDKGAAGIGLFRTEMLFMDCPEPPSEEEHYEQYYNAAVIANGKPVTIRTFDIGGDKEVQCLNLPKEENPFLGYRGVRIYKEYDKLFRDQIRAILRASAFGNLRVMIPMVSCVEEVVYVRTVLEEIKEELREAKVEFNDNISLGINVEIPAAGFIIPQVSELIEFVSLGTNDLTQYFTAVDRGNKQISALYQSKHPGFLKFVKFIVSQCHEFGLKVSVCGEMAGVRENLPFMIAASVDELSVSIPSILEIKSSAGKLDSEQCTEVLRKASAVGTIEEVNSVLTDFNSAISDRPIVHTSLVNLDADCLNKPEVIKLVSCMLLADERTDSPVDLEKDFWKRESVYSTGLGYGIAVPHCKSPYIKANTITVLKLQKAVDWESIDSIPVDTVIAMTIPETEQAGNLHMKIFSKLARHIMHEDFRNALRSCVSSEEIVAFLHEKLELDS